MNFCYSVFNSSFWQNELIMIWLFIVFNAVFCKKEIQETSYPNISVRFNIYDGDSWSPIDSFYVEGVIQLENEKCLPPFITRESVGNYPSADTISGMMTNGDTFTLMFMAKGYSFKITHPEYRPVEVHKIYKDCAFSIYCEAALVKK